MQPKLIVHGGAWAIPPAYHEDHIKGINAAVEKVYPLLKQGLGAVEAVELAVNALESDPTFDAGRGAFLNREGNIELDAMIMDGSNLEFGAVAGVKNLPHPVSLAKKVMAAPDFRMLVGEGAQIFARAQGFEELPPEELLTERELEYYRSIKNDTSFRPIDAFSGPSPSDTVGAVAMDKDGNLACATSTGGTPRKHPGRVGDSPIVGSGGYADNSLGAASCTGYGESIMRVVLCKTACDLLHHFSAMESASQSISVLAEKGKGFGGIIVIDREGRYGYNHNTPFMAYAFIENDNIRSAIAKGK